MATAISGFIALVLLIIYKVFRNDPMAGMASAFFWLIFAGASFIVSGFDPADIYFYFFWAGVGMCIVMLIMSINFSPTADKKQEDIQDGVKRSYVDKARARFSLKNRESR